MEGVLGEEGLLWVKERGFKECLLGKLRQAYQDSALKGTFGL